MRNPKALFVVVNAGFAEEIVDIARGEGASLADCAGLFTA